MATSRSIYKSEASKKAVLELYDKKARNLDFPFDQFDIATSYGNTRVLTAGNEKGKKIVLFHGVHAGAPLSLESIKNLIPTYMVYAIDTIGQATKSAETIMNIKDDSFAKWAEEVLDGLFIRKADFIGVSYGAFILQKLIIHRSQKLNQCIFIVPSGLANGGFWSSFKKLSLPLLRYQISKKDKDLRKFVRHFVPEGDEYMFEFQKAILQGVHLDYRRPSILQQADVAHFSNPVSMILADDDVFFPAAKIKRHAEKIFQNLKEVYLLKGCKHIPNSAHLREIEQKIKEWVG